MHPLILERLFCTQKSCISGATQVSKVSIFRLNKDSVTGFVSIQRGCDNMCAYCIVPFTRGRERSRPLKTILDEVRALVDSGIKEVTLLGELNEFLRLF